MWRRWAVALALVLSACTVLPQGPPGNSRTGTRRLHRVDFGPHAVTFISPSAGWALAQEGCSGCMALFRTRDAGRHWRRISRPRLRAAGPAALVSGEMDLLFADARDGYLVVSRDCESHCASMTTDGGMSWHSVAVPAVTELTAAGGYVYALTAHTLFVTRPGAPRWHRERLPAKGSNVSMSAGAAGTVALLRTGTSHSASGRLLLSTDEGRHWSARPVPCSAADGAASLVGIASNDANKVLIDCFDGLQSSQAQHTQHHAYASTDSGRDWIRLADPINTGDPALLVENGRGHEFVAVESGTADLLAATRDGGRNWHTVLTTRSGFFGWGDLHFVNDRTGFVLGPTHYEPEHIFRTTDGGRTWRPIPPPRPPG